MLSRMREDGCCQQPFLAAVSVGTAWSVAVVMSKDWKRSMREDDLKCDADEARNDT